MDKKKTHPTPAAVLDPLSLGPHQPPVSRRIQNFVLVWVDANIDQVKNKDYYHSITRLRQVIIDVNTFTNVTECTTFISNVRDEKVLVISSGSFGQTVVPLIDKSPQVSAIYIFCGDKARHQQWAKDWPKIEGVFTDMEHMCQALATLVQRRDQNAISISFIGPNDDTADRSFTSMQAIKDILLTSDFEQQKLDTWVKLYREQLIGNHAQLGNVKDFEQSYRKNNAIWWYTHYNFYSSILNRAFHTMEMDLMLSMGFFAQDLHKQIVALHSELKNGDKSSPSFTVYRGQSLSHAYVDQLMNKTGGLLSFNNFLLTTRNRQTSIHFVNDMMKDPKLVGVLFTMTIDPSITSTPFASTAGLSFSQDVDGIIFSMHPTFRIDAVKKLDGSSRSWEINSTLVADNDPQLQKLTERIREEGSSNDTGQQKLGKLMLKLEQFRQAGEIYETLLKQADTEVEKARLCHQLGWIKNNQGQYAQAVKFYEESIRIKQKLSPTDPNLVMSQNCLGQVLEKMGEYKKALEVQERTLQIRQRSLPPDHPHLATSYNNVGSVHHKLGEYQKALSYFEKALVIRQKNLPDDHSSLAVYYNNIGLMHRMLGDHSKALSQYEKALNIKQKSLSPNPLALAISHNNIGLVYDNMGEYSKALTYYQKALEIKEKNLSENHPSLATSYNNIGTAYASMNTHSKALSFHEKALKIYQTTLSANHPDLATSCNNIGLVHQKMGDQSKARSYFERALTIGQGALPANHPNLQIYQQSMESTKKSLT